MKKTIFVKKTEDFFKNLHIDFIKKLYVFDEIDSTNSTAKEFAQTRAEEGTVVIARTQKHGHGRFNRIWQSPEGGVYLSVILRPKKSNEKITLLPFVAALAVAMSIRRYDLQSTIKWPNDIQINGKKIAGILLESEGKGDTIKYVVVGIGVNLNTDQKNLSSDIQNRSTSIYNELDSFVDYYEFIKIFFTQFVMVYSQFINNQFQKIIDEWKIYADTLGKTIRVQTSSETLQGIAVDIDPSGFLLLRTETGEIKKILSGDCFYLNVLDHT